MKAVRVSQNIWGNWNGYFGRKKVAEFGTDSMDAGSWRTFFNVGHSVDDLLVLANPKAGLVPTELNWLSRPAWGVNPQFFELGPRASIQLMLSVFLLNGSQLGILAKKVGTCELVMIPLYTVSKDGLVLDSQVLAIITRVPDLVLVMEAWRRRKSLDSALEDKPVT